MYSSGGGAQERAPEVKDHAQGGWRWMLVGTDASTRGLQGRAVSRCGGENRREEGSRGWGDSVPLSAGANDAAGGGQGWVSSGMVGFGGIWANKKLSCWDKSCGCINGSWRQGRSWWPRSRRKGSGCPSTGHRAALLGGASGEEAVNLACVATRSSYRVFITSITAVQELLCHHKPLCYCGSGLSDVSRTDIAHLPRVTAAPLYCPQSCRGWGVDIFRDTPCFCLLLPTRPQGACGWVTVPWFVWGLMSPVCYS